MAQFSPNCVELDAENLESLLSTRVLLVYRDAAHRSLGKSYCERLSELAHPSGRWQITEWKFDMLAVNAMRELATKDAIEAPLVVITTRGGEEFCSELKLWLKQWEEQQLFPSMLVVLLSSNFDYSEPNYSDYFLLKSELGEHGDELMVYASGSPVERSTSFSFGAARRVTPDGLVMVTEFPELVALARSAIERGG